MPCCEISDCAQTSKTTIAVRHFGLGGRKSLETAVKGPVAKPAQHLVMHANVNFSVFIDRIRNQFLKK